MTAEHELGEDPSPFVSFVVVRVPIDRIWLRSYPCVSSSRSVVQAIRDGEEDDSGSCCHVQVCFLKLLRFPLCGCWDWFLFVPDSGSLPNLQCELVSSLLPMEATSNRTTLSRPGRCRHGWFVQLCWWRVTRSRQYWCQLPRATIFVHNHVRHSVSIVFLCQTRRSRDVWSMQLCVWNHGLSWTCLETNWLRNCEVPY